MHIIFFCSLSIWEIVVVRLWGRDSRETRCFASATRVVASRLCMKWTRRTTSFPSSISPRKTTFTASKSWQNPHFLNGNVVYFTKLYLLCILHLLLYFLFQLVWYTKAGVLIYSQFHFWAKSVPREVFDPQSAFLCRKGWKKGDSYCLANVEAPIFFLELIRSSWEFRVPLLIKQTLPWKCFF